MKRNRRRGGRAWIVALRATSRAAGALLALALLAGAFSRVTAWVRAHPYFALREIDVEAAGGLDGKTVLEWAALTPGMSIWSVDERRAERRLLSEGRVRAAHVKRTLPGRVTIRVEERRPIAVLLASRRLLVAADGTVFPALEGEATDGLPYLSGIAADVASPVAEERLREAARLVARWREHAEWPPLSEVRPDGDDLVVFLAGTPLSVRFSADARAEDFSRLSAVFDLWRGREALVAAIDVSMPGQAVTKLRIKRLPATGYRLPQNVARRSDDRSRVGSPGTELEFAL